jgi:hypothetical protein
MKGFVRIVILIHKPGLSLSTFNTVLSEIRIQRCDPVSDPSRQHPSGPSSQPSIPVVQSNNDVSSRTKKLKEPLKPTACIIRVVENSCADHYIKDLRTQGQSEEVHLPKSDPAKAVDLLEILG